MAGLGLGQKARTYSAPVKINGSAFKKVKRIFAFAGDQQYKFFIGLIFLFLTGATALAFPALMKKLVDASSISQEEINKTGLILLAVFVAQAIFSYCRVLLFVSVSENLLFNLRNTLYGSIIKMPMNFFSSQRVGDLNSRMSSDVTQLQDTFTNNIAEFLRQVIIIIGGITALFLTSIKLAVVMLITLPIFAMLAVYFGRKIRVQARKVQDEIALSNTIVEETFQGISNVKAFTNELFEIARYSKSSEHIRGLAIKGGKARALFFSFIIFCLFGAMIFLVWYAVKLESAGELTHGTVIEFILYSAFVGGSISGVAEQYAQIQKGLGAAERITELLDSEKEEISENKTAALKGNISFENVSFSYASRAEVQVLKDISFTIPEGKTVALVGSSGAGKSTITSLLLRFYEPTSGSINVNVSRICNLTLQQVRNSIAIVPQEVLLFGGTIYENIAYGKPGASLTEVEEAARKANAHQFISQFPDGYETIVGERGIKLSGGQRQRVAIARAVLKDPVILILDEATSSLDSESEKLVQDALEKLMQGRTSLVIAHRLSTIVNADKIVVLDNGKIVESGKHDELINIDKGFYRNLSKNQWQLFTAVR